MTYDKALKWLVFAAFGTGFVIGQDYHTGFAILLGSLFQLAAFLFVVAILINLLEGVITWKDPQSPPKTRPSSKGMGVTVAAAARATGTHVTVLDPEKQQASLGEGQKQDMPILRREHPSRPGFAPGEKRPDAGLDG